MLLGHLQHEKTFAPFLTHPVWQKIKSWLIEQAPQLADGEYEIAGRDIYAIIQEIETLPIEKAIFESHQKYIDIHYCLEGGERIDWALVGTLTPSTEYDKEKDYTLYHSLPTTTSCLMTPGTLAIFLPHDAHMPKINDGIHPTVRKIVVKVRVN